MAIICQETESRNNGFQCVKKITSSTDPFDKRRKGRECVEEDE